MPLKHLEARDERDALEFIDVGLSRLEAELLMRRLLREQAGTEEVDMIRFAADAWLFGATAARFAMTGRDVCHVCGCHEASPCETFGHACERVDLHLCSECEV